MTLSAESGPPRQCRKDILKIGLAVVYYLCRSKLLKRGPQSQLGVNGTQVSLVRILVCVWLGRTRGQRVLAACVCVLWNEPEREGVNECAYDVQLGI